MIQANVSVSRVKPVLSISSLLENNTAFMSVKDAENTVWYRE
jgi:hypothetical protein